MWLYWQLTVLQFKSALQYRASFLTQIIGIIVGYGGNIIIYWMMFNSFNDMNGWTFKQTLFVYSFAGLAINISALLFNHYLNIDNDIVSGGFDKYLIRPISPWRYYFISHFDINQFGALVFSLIVFVLAVVINDISFQFLSVLFLLIGLSGAILINASFLVMIGNIAFWTKKSSSLYGTVLWPAQFLTYLPLPIFPVFIQILFTFILPLGFISYYPTRYFFVMDWHSGLLSLLTFIIGLVTFSIVRVIWGIGIKRYESSGN